MSWSDFEPVALVLAGALGPTVVAVVQERSQRQREREAWERQRGTETERELLELYLAIVDAADGAVRSAARLSTAMAGLTGAGKRQALDDFLDNRSELHSLVARAQIIAPDAAREALVPLVAAADRVRALAVEEGASTDAWADTRRSMTAAVRSFLEAVRADPT